MDSASSLVCVILILQADRRLAFGKPESYPGDIQTQTHPPAPPSHSPSSRRHCPGALLSVWTCCHTKNGNMHVLSAYPATSLTSLTCSPPGRERTSCQVYAVLSRQCVQGRHFPQPASAFLLRGTLAGHPGATLPGAPAGYVTYGERPAGHHLRPHVKLSTTLHQRIVATITTAMARPLAIAGAHMLRHCRLPPLHHHRRHRTLQPIPPRLQRRAATTTAQAISRPAAVTSKSWEVV